MIEIYIQARMGSTRLPGKVLMPVLGKPLLKFLIERVNQSSFKRNLVILTTQNSEDNVIEDFCNKSAVLCFRGSEHDVLSRYYQLALERSPRAIVRLTADCPLIDPDILDQVIELYCHHESALTYASNTLQRTFPRGLDVEVFSTHALEKAFRESKEQKEREHVTPYIYKHPEIFLLKNLAHDPILAGHRWTVDTIEDFRLVKLILEHLYETKPRFRMKDVLDVLKKNPHWNKINQYILQKEL